MFFIEVEPIESQDVEVDFERREVVSFAATQRELIQLLQNDGFADLFDGCVVLFDTAGEVFEGETASDLSVEFEDGLVVVGEADGGEEETGQG